MITHPIPPIYDKNSRILILGSFPSVKSREQMFFYGHPQNRFWKVTASVFGEAVPETVEEILLTEPKDVRDNLDPVYEQLVDAIEGKELLIKPEETLRVMKVMEAAFESAEKGISISVDI